MLKSCFCCGRKSKDEEDLKQRNSGEARELKEKKDASIKRNEKILREDLYQNYMKPYFKLGYGYKDFMKLFFQINDYEVLPSNPEEDNQSRRNWCERNLIIKDPSKSRIFAIWELLFLVAFLVEIVLVPYT